MKFKWQSISLGKGFVDAFGGSLRLLLMLCLSMLGGLAIGIDPAHAAGLMLGVWIATEVAGLLYYMMDIDAQDVIAWLYAQGWRWGLRRWLGDACPLCGGPMSVVSGVHVYEHIRDCPGTDDARRLRQIEQILPATVVHQMINEYRGLGIRFPELDEYADLVNGHNEGERETVS